MSGPKAYALLHRYEWREAKGGQQQWLLDEWRELWGAAIFPAQAD